MRSELGPRDDGYLPWLDTVEEEYREKPGIGRVVLLALLGIAVIGSVIAVVWWLQNQGGQQGDGQLIEAPPGDYKVKPDDVGGMKVDGEGGTAFATGEGAIVNASIDPARAPEAPIDVQKAQAPKSGAAPEARKASVAVPAGAAALTARAPGVRAAPAAPASGSSVVQLGAFPDAQRAETAWRALADKFPALARLGKSVERAEKDGKPIYRLRVNSGSTTQAREICAKLQAAQTSCYVVN
ncbi:MAG: SPOR domain-containing protein [Sphingomonas sp.]